MHDEAGEKVASVSIHALMAHTIPCTLVWRRVSDSANAQPAPTSSCKHTQQQLGGCDCVTQQQTRVERVDTRSDALHLADALAARPAPAPVRCVAPPSMAVSHAASWPLNPAASSLQHFCGASEGSIAAGNAAAEVWTSRALPPRLTAPSGACAASAAAHRFSGKRDRHLGALPTARLCRPPQRRCPSAPANSPLRCRSPPACPISLQAGSPPHQRALVLASRAVLSKRCELAFNTPACSALCLAPLDTATRPSIPSSSAPSSPAVLPMQPTLSSARSSWSLHPSLQQPGAQVRGAPLCSSAAASCCCAAAAARCCCACRAA